MRRPARIWTALCVLCAMVTPTAACAMIAPPDAADAPTRTEALGGTVADDAACDAVQSALEQFSAVASVPGTSVEDYAGALSSLALDLGDAADGLDADSAVRRTLSQSAISIATATDAYTAASEMSTTGWLAVRTAVADTTEVCDLPDLSFE